MFEIINRKTNLNILLIEYNGYGNSEGIPSLKNTNKNIISLLKKNNKKFNEYIIWGRSIGSAHAYDFTMNYPEYSDKLIIQSGFTSPVNAITDNNSISYLLKKLMFFDYEAKPKIEKIIENKNLKEFLIIHGVDDELFNIKYAKQKYEIFKENDIYAKKDFFKGDHNSFSFNEDILYSFLNN